MFVFFRLVLQNEVDKDPDCELDNCDTDSNEIPDVYLSPNKRFWLVTTLYDHLTDEDIPLLQERLADVYRITFTKYVLTCLR